MDGRGRLTQPLMRWVKTRLALAGANGVPSSASAVRRRRRPRRPTRMERRLRRWIAYLAALPLPRGTGSVVVAITLIASVGFGVVQGGHLNFLVAQVDTAGNAIANRLGFRISSISLTGNKQMSREEVFAIAGITGESSLLLLDVADVRQRLRANPWVADATVLKLYPDQLQIAVDERKPFALWQKDGRVSVIADDGTVVQPYVARQFYRLPLVVGVGAATHAKQFLAALERYPVVRGSMHAAVFVAERRWNIRLKNGIDIRLPEDGIAAALALLVRLDREKKLFSRDITTIDLRLPDRVMVQLSEDAAKARADALKETKTKRKGGNA
jgi:cell division protein FtsQ